MTGFAHETAKSNAINETGTERNESDEWNALKIWEVGRGQAGSVSGEGRRRVRHRGRALGAPAAADQPLPRGRREGRRALRTPRLRAVSAVAP